MDFGECGESGAIVAAVFSKSEFCCHWLFVGLWSIHKAIKEQFDLLRVVMSNEIHIDFISYSGERPRESHLYAQILVAAKGGMEMEIAGRAGKLSTELGAFVPPGAPHSQLAMQQNSFLLLNCPQQTFGSPLTEFLANRIFLPISPPVRQLINFVEAVKQEGLPLAPLAENWTQLLLGSIIPHAPSLLDARIVKLEAAVKGSLDLPWTVEDMARRISLSPSRLYALFQEKMNTTPQNWLTDLKIRQVQKWLVRTDLPIAELAQRVGYSDQSALTKVMRRVTGKTPSVYRKQQQEFWPKGQE